MVSKSTPAVIPGIADAAVAAEPADGYPVTNCPASHPLPQGVDPAGDLVTEHGGPLDG
jgi:hypothetical protein